MLKFKFISIISYILFFPVFIASSIILILISFIHLPTFFILDKFFCRIIMLTLFISPKIVGNFPKDNQYIIMMNHSSFIDAFLFPLIPVGAYSGVTAKNNFKIPVFSSLIKRIKAIPIDRYNLESAIKSINKAEEVLKQGIHIGILPEGTRSLNGKMLPLKKGGFHMAINTNTAIVPVGIRGAFSFKPKNRWWTMPTKITINIGEKINTKIYSEIGIKGLKNLVESKLKALSGENNDKL